MQGAIGYQAQIQEWTKYINFEISQEQPRRARLLYERAMASSLEAENDTELWLRYTAFILDHLKDASLVRAKFEQKLTYAGLLSAKNQVDLLIESAIFEEMQSNSLRARRIYEQLDQEIGPGLIRATIARINFEKRQGNVDKARELYFKAFKSALERNNSPAVTYIATQYARFLAFKCGDHSRALEILNQAISNPACTNKVLILSYVNLARSLTVPDSAQLIK